MPTAWYFDEEIRVSIQIVPLDDNHWRPYEALSYTWGSSKDQVDISIATHQNLGPLQARARTRPGNWRHLAVTQNLSIALRHLRLKDKARVLWIDAICVNQRDLQERGCQVERMAYVYRSASLVVI